jgi:integrase
MGDLGQIDLTKLSRTDVSKWVNGLAAKELSGKTIRNVHGFLSGALNEAVRQKLISENPCAAMRMPTTSHKSTEMTFLTREEFADLYELVDPHYQPLVLTLVGTGMRFGEATALMVADVDIEHSSLRVRQAWKKTGNSSREIGAPKTKRSIRTIPLAPEVKETLARLIANKSHGDFVFTNKQNLPINASTFREQTWLPAVQDFAGDEVEIVSTKWNSKRRVVIKEGSGKHPRLHDLRHSFVSWAIQASVPLPVIQRTLGHESITTTIDRYGHLARADFDALAASIGNFLPDTKAIELNQHPRVQ